MSPWLSPPRPQGVSRSRRCREPRAGDDAAGGMQAGSPPPPDAFPSPLPAGLTGVPTRGEKVPTRVRPPGRQRRAPRRWQRGDGLGVGWEPLPGTSRWQSPPSGCQSPPTLRPQPPVMSLTVTFHPLVNKPVQQRPAVVTEGGAGVCVDFKFVFAPGILGGK